MKQKLNIMSLLVALILTAACSSSTTDAQQSIQWYSLNDGLAAVRESGKQVMLYTQAQW